MASYSTVRYGSQGEDVIKLQMALNAAGYDLETDGIFGKKTQQAVRDYQSSNGLTIDGIVGKNTWGSLSSYTSAPKQENKVEYEPFVPEPYTPEPEVQASRDALSNQLEALIAQFNSTPTYTPKTSDEIREQATGEYQSYYDQLRLAAQQQQERNNLAIVQQREQLAKTYEDQKAASEREYANAYSTADRQMLSRGMQRSSYAAQTLANIDSQGAQAQQAIADAQAAAEGNIDEQRTMLAQQLAAQLAQYDAGQAADILNRIRELEDQEYQRGIESANLQNSLSAQIYDILYQQQRDLVSDEQFRQQFEYQQYRDQVADQQWQQQYEESVRQFDESQKKRSSGGSSSKSSSSVDAGATQAAASPLGSVLGDFSSFVNALSGTTKTIASSVKESSSAPSGSGGKLGTVKTDEKLKKR